MRLRGLERAGIDCRAGIGVCLAARGPTLATAMD